MKVKAALKEQAKSLLVPVLFLLAIGIVALTVSLIPEDVFSVTLWQAEMPIREPVPIHADGNILLWRRSVRENTCRYLKMREELLFLIPRISVW